MFANDSVFQLQASDWSLKARNEANKPENAEINQIYTVKP